MTWSRQVEKCQDCHHQGEGATTPANDGFALSLPCALAPRQALSTFPVLFKEQAACAFLSLLRAKLVNQAEHDEGAVLRVLAVDHCVLIQRMTRKGPTSQEPALLGDRRVDGQADRRGGRDGSRRRESKVGVGHRRRVGAGGCGPQVDKHTQDRQTRNVFHPRLASRTCTTTCTHKATHTTVIMA